MNERIIVLPSINKINISLAYHNKSSFNMRVFTPIQLCEDGLLRQGIICDKTFISKEEELVIYKDIIKNIDYFKNGKLADLKALNQTINTIRLLVIEKESEEIENTLNKGIFENKNKALIEVYKQYINKLNDDNKIDTIGLIRYGIENNKRVYSKINIIKEYPLGPLYLELIKSLGDIEEISIFDLYEVNDKKINIKSYKNCYGSSNEIGEIIDDIFTHHNMDECVIACADYKTYSNIIYDYACKYKFNVTFNNGLSLLNSYPGKLLKQYYDWMSIGNYGWEPFNKLINSPYFNKELLNDLIDDNIDKNKLFEIVSRLRITNDIEINKQRLSDFKNSITRDINDNDKLYKYIPYIEIIINELNLPIEVFISKYSLIRNDNIFNNEFDKASIKAINKEVLNIRNIDIDIDEDVINNILTKNIYRKASEPNHIHVCDIGSALSSLRKVLYVCGLSSLIYPGASKENYLLLDSDLNDFNNTDLTSKAKILEKKQTLFDLISLASGLNNEIYLSYPGLNVSELKNNNASSLLFELYKKQYGQDVSLDEFNKKVEVVSYFKPNLSNTRLIGEAYNACKLIVSKALDFDNQNKTIIDIHKYSPSALNIFFNCKKQFFYQNLLKIKVEDDYDPYEVISATKQGSLVHSLMEYLADHKMSKQEFLSLANNCFDEYMNICVPLIKEKIENVKQEFIEMLENGYDLDEKYPRELLLKEEDLNAIHDETGIMIHGFPDRVEKDENGNAIIIDFKTERDKNSHLHNDIDTCLQVLIYSYVIEKCKGIKVDHCEYRMLRYRNYIVTCDYNDELKKKLNDKLIEFKKCLDEGNFEIEPMSIDEEKEKCKYCKYGSICGKVVLDE